MIRLYLIPLISVCVLFSACSNPTASNTESSITDESISTTKQTTQNIESALDKAQLATEKASKKVDSVLKGANKVAQSASKVVEDVIVIKTQLQEMSQGAGNTLTAVHSGDFKTAQQEFAQLQENWNQIKHPVQKHSPQAYQEINTYLTNIDTLLKQPNPNHAELARKLSLFADSNSTLLDNYSKKH
jgi:predicted  nucleic acid-binding Zn-ribbon protein